MKRSVVSYLLAGGKAALATKDTSGSLNVVGTNPVNIASPDLLVCVPKSGVSRMAWANVSVAEVKQQYPNVHIDQGSVWL